MHYFRVGCGYDNFRAERSGQERPSISTIFNKICKYVGLGWYISRERFLDPPRPPSPPPINFDLTESVST